MQKIQYSSDFSFNCYEFLPGFICANNTESLINGLFEAKILDPFLSFTSSPPSSPGMSDESTDCFYKTVDSSFLDQSS